MPLTVRYQATGETRAVTGRYLLAGSQEMYLRSATVAAVFKAGRFWQAPLRQLDLKVGDADLPPDRRQPAGASRDEGEVLLPVPVLDHDGDLWLPLILLEQVIGPQIRRAGGLGPGRAPAGAGQRRVQRHAPAGRGPGPHHGGAHRLRRAAGLPRRQPAPGRHRAEDLRRRGQHRARWRQARAAGLLRSAPQPPAAGPRAGHRCRSTSWSAATAPTPPTTAARSSWCWRRSRSSAMPDPVPRGAGRREHRRRAGGRDPRACDVRTVVIDPGHGGHDVGAVGRRGILEKDVNLGVARELRRYLRARERPEGGADPRRGRAPRAGRPRRDRQQRRRRPLPLPALQQLVQRRRPRAGDLLPVAGPERLGQERRGGREPGRRRPSADDVEFIVWELVQNRFISQQQPAGRDRSRPR